MTIAAGNTAAGRQVWYFECDPHNLIASRTIPRCGFVQKDIALLEEVCQPGVFYAQDTAQCLS